MNAQPNIEAALKAQRISELTAAWNGLNEQLVALKEQEMTVRKELFALAFGSELIGTSNYELGQGYKLKGVGKLNYNLADGEGQTKRALDQIEAMGEMGPFIAERLVSWKPTLSVSEYKKLDAEGPYKRIIDAVLTTSPATPSLEIVAPKAKK